MTNETLLKTAVLCKAAYNGVKVGQHSFIVDSDGFRTVIAIAGTANFENVLEDASVWPSWTPTKKLAHAGVMDAYKGLENAVLERLPKNSPIVFAGHSLGGGIAQIFAEKLNCEVITFGSLKTYFKGFAKDNPLHTRIACDDDPVPWVPGMLYAHNCDAVTINDRDYEWLDIKDHYIDNYIKRLEGLK